VDDLGVTGVSDSWGRWFKALGVSYIRGHQAGIIFLIFVEIKTSYDFKNAN
jgi:hypothetical protein